MHSLVHLLARHREAILAEWFAAVRARHSSAGHHPLAGAAPERVREALQRCFDAVSGADEAGNAAEFLPDLAQWLAVQDCGPEEALVCLLLLKPLLRDRILPHQPDPREYLEAESRLDSLSLLLSADYTRCRERMHMSRLKAAERQHDRLRRWAERHGFFSESPL